mgnify:CR=1 FL=1
MERNKRSPICKNLIPGLTERGKIKIGCKGAMRKSSAGNPYQQPVKLDHFIVTTLERSQDGNFVKDETIHKIIGDKPKEIPVMLMFDDIALNFQCRYACYNGKTLFCSGDGEFADQLTEQKTRKEVSCPCYRHEPTYTGKDKCKINGTLSVMIQGVNHVGGIHKFRTTGYNSTVGILSSLTLIRSLTGGYLAGLPLKMTIQPKVCTSPVDGSSQTVYVVGVEFAGSLSDLQQKTLQIAQGNAEFKARMLNVENEVRKLISVDASLIDEAGDITEEFYPDEEPETLAEPAGTVTESAETPAPTETPAPAKNKRKRKSAAAEPSQSEPAPDPESEPEQIQNPVGDADFDIEM